ncbi:unnamed protein product [Fraxinus pennsylvanica]|uniref:Pentatricopeptide repeat-containing protein n=1 Tax=Fraxinus pennsylvanica TaxID=56036 RepID=A0AAD1Z753_9LAMI|nr:unnamed protein product [Fraxinus pennsylvanica]
MECDMVIGTVLVDIRRKCRRVERAFEAFNGMPKKDVMEWTSMLSAFALHGHGNEAFKAFENMETVGVRPNSVTFVGLLSTCTHSGLVEKALARGRLFVEAEELIRVYAKACRFDDLKRMRALMKDTEFRKSVPGCSMIEVDGIVHEFFVKGSPDVLMREAIQSVSVVLSHEMKRNQFEYFHPIIGG